MPCCDEPTVVHDDTHTKATCRSCGFGWSFKRQGKGRRMTKDPKWGPNWFCQDDYDRAWRLRDYNRHEIIGTRQKGRSHEYMCGCSKSLNTFSVSKDNPPDEVYCPFCERSGLIGPMLNRYRERKG